MKYDCVPSAHKAVAGQRAAAPSVPCCGCLIPEGRARLPRRRDADKTSQGLDFTGIHEAALLNSTSGSLP